MSSVFEPLRFNRLLKTIGDGINHDDLDDMKHLVRGIIGKKYIQRSTKAIELLVKFVEHGLISDRNLVYLQILLLDIARKDLNDQVVLFCNSCHGIIFLLLEDNDKTLLIQTKRLNISEEKMAELLAITREYIGYERAVAIETDIGRITDFPVEEDGAQIQSIPRPICYGSCPYRAKLTEETKRRVNLEVDKSRIEEHLRKLEDEKTMLHEDLRAEKYTNLLLVKDIEMKAENNLSQSASIVPDEPDSTQNACTMRMARMEEYDKFLRSRFNRANPRIEAETLNRYEIDTNANFKLHNQRMMQRNEESAKFLQSKISRRTLEVNLIRVKSSSIKCVNIE